MVGTDSFLGRTIAGKFQQIFAFYLGIIETSNWIIILEASTLPLALATGQHVQRHSVKTLFEAVKE